MVYTENFAPHFCTQLISFAATLQTYVVIKNTYPTPPPIFVLNLNYQGSYNSTNCDEIRVCCFIPSFASVIFSYFFQDMERTLNVDWSDYGSKSSSWLLSAQLSHLCSYLDVYLETMDSKTFPPNTKYIRGIRSVLLPSKCNFMNC